MALPVFNRAPVTILVVLAALISHSSSEGSDLSFAKTFYEAQVEEGAEGEALRDLIAVRVQQKREEGVRYSMTSLVDSRSQDLFDIDPSTGSISARKPLDYEFMDQHYFKVSASSPGSSSPATTTVKISVVDVNDNAPVFEKPSYELSVHESTPTATPLLSVRAVDADSGDNGRVSYSIAAAGVGSIGGSIGVDIGDLFSIDSVGGVVSLQAGLDRESRDSFEVTVVAEDNGPTDSRKSSSATIVVKVLDDNDNFPEFDRPSYHFFISESLSWKDRPSFGQVCAVDRDQGSNAVVRYSIIGGNTDSNFEIGRETGELRLVKPVDREARSQYSLVVRASDLGNPSKSNTTRVKVTLTDVNDNAPRFPAAKYHQTVSENVPTGFSILQTKAYDADEGPNAIVTYRIVHRDPSSLPFEINPESGWLKTRVQLDREQSDSFTFGVEAEDGGRPPRRASVAVTVDVLDTNDNDPSFPQKEYRVTVSELEPPGATVLTLRAHDGDKGGTLRYEIAGGNARNRFTISTSESGEGVISLAQPLNFGQEEEFLLTVNAIDEGGRFGSCAVAIRVADANDHPPRFQNTPYFADVFEDVAVGHTVLMLFASDEDSGENARVTYRLETASSEFAVDPGTGALVVAAPLDRERVSTYILSVSAADSGQPQPLSDVTEVEVSVLDVNDNSPEFSKEVYSGSLSENAPLGTKVLRVSAFDRDERDNGKVSYEIADGASDIDHAFLVDHVSGDIRSNVSLDREARHHYEFEVLALDGGMPPRYGRAKVRISVLDVNDNPPDLSANVRSFSVRENSPYGTRVGKIVADDPDLGPNAVVTFVLLNSTDSKNFFLGEYDADGGIYIFAAKEFDYETDKRSYTVVVRAESAPLRTDVEVRIDVQDVNDNQPTLEDFRIVYNVVSDEPLPAVVGRIPAEDADPTSRLKYNFSYGNSAGVLSVDQSTGDVRLSPHLVDSNVNLRADFGVIVSDGQNEVRARMQLQINHITKEMLRNSVSLRLAGFNASEASPFSPEGGAEAGGLDTFLDPFLSFLEEALVVIVPCAREDITVFGVRGGRDSLNVTFAVSSSDSNGDVFLPPSYVKQRVYLRRDTLEKISSLRLLPFSDDVCVKEPCLNFERCVTKNSFGNDRFVLRSQRSVTFRSVGTLLTYSCFCPAGFTGMTTRYTCDTRIDLCYSSPCQNGATCVSTEEEAICLCTRGFTGKSCETPVPEEKEKETEEECACLECPESSDNCDLSTRSFASGAYIALRELRQRVSVNVTLEFSTRSGAGGVILYNGRLDDQNDFLALELKNPRTLMLHFSTGTDYKRVTLYRREGFADGEFHRVEINYERGEASLSHGHCDKKLALLPSVYNLTPELRCANTTSDSDREEEEECGSFLNQCSKYLDLTAPLMIGALPPTLVKNRRPEFSSSTHFDGCVRGLRVDGAPIKWGSVVFNNASIHGCPEKRDFCVSSPCLNGGTCQNGWRSYRCRCHPGFDGKDCEREVGESLSVSGGRRVLFQKEQIVPVRFPWHQSLSFRLVPSSPPEETELMAVTLESDKTSSLRVTPEGTLVYRMAEEGGGGESGLEIELSASHVNDGRWHHVRVKWMQNETWLSLDFGQLELTRTHLNYRVGALVTKIAVGGKGLDRGCVKNVEVGNEGDTTLKLLTENVKYCEEEGEPCSGDDGDQDCEDKESSEAVTPCLLGPRPQGEGCFQFCDLNLCPKNARCVDEARLGHCECGEGGGGGGRYCEDDVVRDFVCPRHWWGRPKCGPCNCDTARGFNETCHSATGECTCKDNHYFQDKGGTTCRPCGCFPKGSLSKGCDKSTGQCNCKGGVIGRRCDRCAHEFAELHSANGCQVVYGSCPAEFRGSLWWERTAFGRGRTSDCPDGAVGAVARNCTRTGWREPDFSQCVHRDLYMLESASSDAQQESWSAASKLSERLVSMRDGSPFSFAGDVTAASKVLRSVLRKETGMRGFGLAHRKDRNFLRNLLSSFSWVLGRRGAGADADSALLLRQFVAYGSHLADTMEDTFTNPFEVVTDNVIFGLDRYEAGISVEVPKYDNFVPSEKAWNTAAIRIDDSVRYRRRRRSRMRWRREVERLVEGRDQRVVQYMFVRTLSNQTLPRSSLLMPELRWETTARMISDIVAFTTTEKKAEDEIDRATVIFEGRKEKEHNRLYCVDWDLELGVWTTTRCEKEDEEDGVGNAKATTRVTCACADSASRTFALVEERMERGRDFLSTSEQKLAFSLACLLNVVLLACCLLYLLLCNRGARNTVSIHANITFSLLCFEVLLVLTVCFNHAMSLATAGGRNGFACHAVVMLSHFFGLSCFSWSLLSAFHLYRMMKELRNINSGSMSFYTASGYGAPALVVLLTLGAAGKNYSGADVCFVSHDGSSSVLVWSFLAPVAALLLLAFVCVLLNVRMIFLTSSSGGGSGSAVSDVDDIFKLRATFFLNLGVHPLLTGTFLSALVVLYSEQGYLLESCYAFVGLAFATSCYFLVAFVLLDCRMFRRMPKEVKKTSGTSSRARSALSYQPKPPAQGGAEGGGGGGTLEKKHLSPSVASTTSQSTTFRQASTMSHKHSFMDSDSEEETSDLDRRSFDLASSHSSDDNDDDDVDLPSVGNVGSSSYRGDNLFVRDYPLQ